MGIWTQVQLLWGQALYSLSHFLSPHIIRIMIGITVNIRLLLSNINTLTLCNICFFFLLFVSLILFGNIVLFQCRSFSLLWVSLYINILLYFKIITNFILYICPFTCFNVVYIQDCLGRLWDLYFFTLKKYRCMKLF